MRKVKQQTHKSNLTGCIRYRKDFFNSLILQVQVRVSDLSTDRVQFIVRDATREDLEQLNLMGRSPHWIAEQYIDKENEWLTGSVCHRSALFRNRIVLYVEEYDCILTEQSMSYRRAKDSDLWNSALLSYFTKCS